MLSILISLLLCSNVMSDLFDEMDHRHCDPLWNNGVCNPECDQEYQNKSIAGFGGAIMEQEGDCLLYPNQEDDGENGNLGRLIIILAAVLIFLSAGFAQYRYDIAERAFAFRRTFQNIGDHPESNDLETGRNEQSPPPRYVSFNEERSIYGQFDYSRLNEEVY